jgi:excinuclease ABC subunit A
MDKVIEIKGAQEHNLKNVHISLPKNKLIVVTGVSGSGKSSLTIDTLYAEGQRRYIESLSSYARQFLGKIQKPKVDYIKGICPAIALEQKTNTKNPRSTVATSSEIYDYVKILFSRIGKTISPVSGKEVKAEGVLDIIKFMSEFDDGLKVVISFNMIETKATVKEALEKLMQKGFSRLYFDNKFLKIESLLTDLPDSLDDYEVVVDRFSIKNDDKETENRIADSSENALFEGKGECNIHVLDHQSKSFNNRFEIDGMKFERPSTHMFSFTSPNGACPTCEGYGTILGVNPDLVIPDKNLSIYDDGIACWRGEKMKWWKDQVIAGSKINDFPIFRSFSELTEEEIDLLWNGCNEFKGINDFFKELEENAYKIQFRVLLSRYRGKTTCTDCKGTRLKKETDYVKINDTSIKQVLGMSIKDAKSFFDGLSLNTNDGKIAERLVKEINQRLEVLNDVGLGYLGLKRDVRTLSGGESQRINLGKYIGSALVSSLYILDEPSIGLHPRDTERLIKVLKQLKNLQNTVVVVEHDEDIMKSADHVVDMGPLAGELGGEVIFNGDSSELKGDADSLTAKYLNGILNIEIPKTKRKVQNKIRFENCEKHNLKNVNVDIPLNSFVAIGGVSGSGKTTLIKEIIYPQLRNIYENKAITPSHITGDVRSIKRIEFINQNPLGRSSRSNPVTYVKAYDGIRKMLSEQKISKLNGFKPAFFSFNVEGGRCEKCKGDGYLNIEMQFMPDVQIECDECNGNRFKKEVLEVKIKDKSINDILKMTIDDAIEFFEDRKDIYKKLYPLQQVGLGYVRLGQPSNTLSGGEAQRLKLASFLLEANDNNPTLFIFDEPTTGLHFHDIQKLLNAFDALVERGHSILVIEHNLDVLKYADWLIELGPDGGDKGGQIVFEGKPEDIVNVKTETSRYLSLKFQ